MKPYFGATNDKGQWWDGRDWRNPSNQAAEPLRIIETLRNHDRDNCHVDGCFECPRCRKMHFIPDNFDLLCDGCCETVLAHPNATEAMRTGILAWREKARVGKDDVDIAMRLALRESLATDHAR